MKQIKKNWILVGSALAIVIILLAYGRFRTVTPSNITAFAACLKEKKAVFYGAFWCPHCQAQKRIFGSAESLLPYVECSTPDGNAETDICKQAGIKGYPTWQFADGSRHEGEMTLQDLADKTGCILNKK